VSKGSLSQHVKLKHSGMINTPSGAEALAAAIERGTQKELESQAQLNKSQPEQHEQNKMSSSDLELTEKSSFDVPSEMPLPLAQTPDPIQAAPAPIVQQPMQLPNQVSNVNPLITCSLLQINSQCL